MSKELNKKIEEALYNFYKEADKEIVINSLKEDIKDYDAYERKKRQIIFKAKATLNKKKNDNLLALVKKIQEGIERKIDKPITLLKQIIEKDPSLALYRNLDNLSKEDIIEIIKDKNFVDLLEELDENDPKD